MAEDSRLIGYLLGCSEMSMENCLLDRLNDARNRQKELGDLLERWAEVRAEALLFEWFKKHGPELMARVTRVQTITELQRLAEPEKPGPQRVQDFRESLKSLLESA